METGRRSIIILLHSHLGTRIKNHKTTIRVPCTYICSKIRPIYYGTNLSACQKQRPFTRRRVCRKAHGGRGGYNLNSSSRMGDHNQGPSSARLVRQDIFYSMYILKCLKCQISEVQASRKRIPTPYTPTHSRAAPA